MRPTVLFAGLVTLALLVVIVAGAIVGAGWHRRHPGALRERVEVFWKRFGWPWSPRFYLTTHLVVGLCVSLFALWLFVSVADAVNERGAITRLDVALGDTLHAHATSAGIRVARLLSEIGSPIAMTVLMFVVAVVMWMRRERILFATWLAAFVGGSVLDQALKFFFRRPRPTFSPAIIVARGFSFPSGHAMGSLIGFGLVAYLAVRLVHSGMLRMWIVAAASLIIL